MSLLKMSFILLIVSICNARDTAISYVPVVMLGYDVVAYHFNVTGCKSMMGNKNYSYQLVSPDGDGIERVYEFWFADTNNLNIFKTNPWKYAPRFGGFCSFGTCCERQPNWPWSSSFIGPPSGPDHSTCGFRIHTDGYLYFNIYKSYDTRFFDKSNVNQNIQLAKARWISWYGSLKSGPFNFYCFSTNGHSTTYDCIESGQRFAPALNQSDEIYPIDNDYYDEYFNKFNNKDNNGDIETTKVICAHTAECHTCPDGSCQQIDENCNLLSCSPSSYLIWGIIGLIVFLVIVVCVAFFCYRRKNTSLRENFEQLAKDDTIKDKKMVDTNGDDTKLDEHHDAALIQTDQGNTLLVR